LQCPVQPTIARFQTADTVFLKSHKQLSGHHDPSHRIFSCAICQFLIRNVSCFSFPHELDPGKP
jgi:hypothetical protein